MPTVRKNTLTNIAKLYIYRLGGGMTTLLGQPATQWQNDTLTRRTGFSIEMPHRGGYWGLFHIVYSAFAL